MLLLLADYPSLRCLPDALSRLTSLTALSIWRCSGLHSMFAGAGNLCSLQQLKVTDCAQLAELPGDLGSSNSALELLHVNGEWISVQYATAVLLDEMQPHLLFAFVTVACMDFLFF
jgi:hypothetical protein